ncbi:hypothetical protein RI367_000740 [Sorochytrium milnesiophthora]
MNSKVAILVLLCLSAVAAQTYNASQIASVDVSTRIAWCTQQTSVCSNVCANSVSSNYCNYNSLQYRCVCQNGTQPSFSSTIDLTVPYFTCLTFQWTPCFNGCSTGNQTCVDTCNSLYQCGHVQGNATSTAPAPAASTTAAAKPTINSVVDLGAATKSHSTSIASHKTATLLLGLLLMMSVNL